MNPNECELCGEKEPSIIHTIYKDGDYRGRCTDCLIKEHRELFCPFCFKATTELSERTTCLKCTSTAHVSCLRPLPSPSAASSSSLPPPLTHTFTCPPCTDPNFTFFPKSYVNIDLSDLSVYSALALVAVSKFSADILEHAEAQLKHEYSKMMIAAKEAERKRKDIMESLQLLITQRENDLATSHVTPNNNNS